MPYIKYKQSAQALDDARLNNQINECKVMFKSLAGLIGAWKNHPATRMWKGHELALLTYGGVMAATWRDRQGLENDPRQAWFYDMAKEYKGKFLRRSLLVPLWVGDINFHRSHRSNLLRKDPEHYGSMGWGEVPDLMPYLWPRTDRDGKDYGLYLSNSDRAKVAAGELRLPDWLRAGEDGEVLEEDEDEATA